MNNPHHTPATSPTSPTSGTSLTLPKRGRISHKIEGDCGAVVMLGGSSARVVCRGKLGGQISQKLTWMDFKARPENKTRDIGPLATEFIPRFAALMRDVLKEGGVNPRKVLSLGVSVAGRVNSNGTITTTNTGVEFKEYPFFAHLSSELKKIAKIETQLTSQLNDAHATVYGEILHPKGAFRGVPLGLLLILGTGVGGGAQSNGIIVPELTEFGHSLIYDTSREKDPYYFQSLTDLGLKGYYKDNSFFPLPPGLDYFETRCAGPWLAIRFVRSLIHGHGEGLISELAKITGIERQKLDELGDLQKTERYRWGAEANGAHIEKIIRLIRGTQIEDVAALNRFDGALSARLTREAWEFKQMATIEIGLAIRTLLAQHPTARVVMVGGVAETFGSRKVQGADRNFLPIIRRVCGLAPDSDQIVITRLNAEEREALGILGSDWVWRS